MTLLSITRGDTRAYVITLTDEDTGAPFDLTTQTLVFTAKRRLTDADADAVISKTEGAGIEVDADPTTGVVVLTIDGADTEDLDLPHRSLFWDLQVDNGAGDVRTPLSGLLAIAGDVTRTSGGS